MIIMCLIAIKSAIAPLPLSITYISMRDFRCHSGFGGFGVTVYFIPRIFYPGIVYTIWRMVRISGSYILHILSRVRIFYPCMAIKVEEVIKDRTPYIFGRLFSEKETPTSGTQILAQTLLQSDSVHKIIPSNLLRSES